MKNLNLGSSTPSWKQPSGQHHQSADMILPHDYLYDLYAVCNHHGGMHGGHYTGMELTQCLINTVMDQLKCFVTFEEFTF